ncbi:hypothetical protein KCV00_g200, partial [Aureobasidium melanogenum]
MVCGWPYKGVLVDCRSASLSLRSRYSRLRLGRDLSQKNGRMVSAAHSTKCRMYQQMRAMRSKMESWDGQGSGCETSMSASVKQMRDNEDCGFKEDIARFGLVQAATRSEGDQTSQLSTTPSSRNLKESQQNADQPLIALSCRVRTLTGKEIELDIEPDYKVSRIKERVEEKEGIPPAQQRLIFGGKQMNDDKTASEYQLEGGATLHLVLALRGGR